MSKPLKTIWGEQLDPEHVLEEYPRPQMARGDWMNLNGYWDYAFSVDPETPDTWDGRILVPFSPEALLSGVERQLKPDEYLHYRRDITIPEGELKRGRWLLHFGAVDQICAVYVNDRKAGGHTGGYLPFSIDITDLLAEGENTLRVCVKDLSDTSYHARGKQSLKRGGMWYTAQSGIWQTVWMEHVPDVYIKAVKLVPDCDGSAIKIKVLINDSTASAGSAPSSKKVRAVISFHGKVVREAVFKTGVTCCVSLEGFEWWTPEEPNLYDLELSMGEDRVTSYFGMRRIQIRKDRKGILRFWLNGRPYYHNGVLDQGYYSDGLYTAPSDEALQYDIRTMKDLGFNMLRKHIKIEPDRWYYHCDRLGMLVWQDMVSGGSPYHLWFVNKIPFVLMRTGRIVRDRNYRLLARQEAEGRNEYYRELKEMVRHLYNHPCITAWVPFNEGWGQFDAHRAVKVLRRLDPTRMIDQASGWFDQGGGDIYSIHNYWKKLKVKPLRHRVVALTEFGACFHRVQEHSFTDRIYGIRKYASPDALADGLASLWDKELIPNILKGLSASVYTQVSDIEDELNGLLTYDRKLLKVSAERVRSMNRKLKEAFLASW